MALNFNTEPYYDDFDESKNYHRILFRPGYAVQARELTQLQTQIQNQIKKFGDHVFVDGTLVLDGQRYFENDLTSIKIDSSYFGSLSSEIDITGLTLTGLTSETKATIKAVIRDTIEGNKLIVKVISGSGFVAAETIELTYNSVPYQSTIQLVDPFSNAMMFAVAAGIYYIRGKFVYCESQTTIVDSTSNTSSKNIGFIVTEEIVTADMDESLLDRAQGSPNYAAPGADRHGITLQLVAKDLSTVENDFIEIARVVNGQLVINLEKTIYSEIGNELARRTYDESGDYTVKPWKLQIEDHSTDVDKFVVALEPGKGYIKGYEFETINQTFLDMDRAREFEQTNDLNVAIDYGNYVYVNTLSGEFNTSTLESVNLRDGTTANIGTARVRYLKWNSGSIGAAGASDAIYRMYLFNISMDAGKTFKEVSSVTSATGSATIDNLSKISGTDTFLTGSDSPGLVFPIGAQFIKTVRDGLGASQTNFQIQRAYTSVTFSATGVADIATATANERFVGSGVLSSTLKNENYHVVVTTAGGGFSVGDVIDFTISSRTITVGTDVPGSTQTLTLNANTGSGFVGTIIATIDVNAQLEKTKTLSGYTKGVITTDLNQTLGGKDSLEVSDVYDILSVYNIGNDTGSTVTVNSTTGEITWNGVANTDVTANYTLDNGQRAELYDHGALILTGTSPVTNTDNLLVVYRNFSHTGNGFFSVDSYSVSYENIPTFTDPSSGRVYELRDCLDFRPRRQDGASTLLGAQLPSPSTTLEADYQYYMGRMDRIIAMPDRSFLVKKGIPSVIPVLPVNDTNGMVIYEVIIPPYTVSIEDISVKFVDNKRYTMRDIGKIDKRVKTLEYYTQLSLLEKQAKDTSIPDATNFEKFKNGIAVDPFTSQDIFVAAGGNWSTRRWGWWNAWFNGSNTWNSFGAQNYSENSIAEPGDIDFNAAIDPLNQELRAPFLVQHLQFDTTTLTNTAKDGELVTLTYSEVPAVEQTLATTFVNINPFDVVKFVGKLDLEPPFDNWIDTQTLPVINRVVDVRVPDAADRTVDNFTGNGNAVRITNTSTSIVTNVLASSTTSLGASVVDVQFVPYIRSNTVIGIGKLFKPKARLWPFVENTPVTSYCKPLTVLTITPSGSSTFNDSLGVYESLSFTGGATARTAIFSPPTTADNTKRLLVVFGVTGTISVGNTMTGANGGTATVNVVQNYNLSDPIIPDEFGYVGFEFQIPSGVFKTGERTVRLIDDETNNANLQSSFGEVKYTATGILQSKQDTILTTRTVQNQRVTTRTGTRFWADPTAQTFLVDGAANPEGLYVSSVEVYFRTKSSTIPVTMQIRRTVNGYPESTPTIPFSEVTLNPESVITSTDGSVSTKFTFKSPVHLVPGEYAIVLLANSSDYNVYVAEVGQTVIGGSRVVDKQPYAGSLFVSQNASTWTAEQNKDLAFKINRADFTTSGSVTFEIQDPSSVHDYYNLFVNTSTIAPSNTTILWEAKSYNAGGTFDSDFTRINVDQDVEYTVLKRLIEKASTPGNVASLILRANLETTNSKVSPAVDPAALAIVATINDINNDSANETGKQGGNALARYITKPIVLADGFDASNLCVTVDINKPSGTDVKAYYRILATEKTTPISDESWIEMALENSVSNSASTYEYKEHRFFPVGAFDTFGVPQDGPITTRFNTFQVKFVMLSTSKTLTPKCRDLRIIALDE